MNYQKRFNNIVEKIGVRKTIKGIDKIYQGVSGYTTITTKGIEIAQGCDGGLYKVEILGKGNWDILTEDLSQRMADWFLYVERKVNEATFVSDEVVVDGRRYGLIK